MTAALKRLIRKKQGVYNRARHYSRESDWLEYKSLQKNIDRKLKYQHKTYLTDMISSPDNKKPLWRYIKTKRKDHTGIGTLKDPVNGQPITDPASKADILNQHFKSVFTTEDRSNIPDKGSSPYPSIADFRITSEGVYRVLSNCNPHKSPGPDAIHPYALKATATEVTPILTHIFQTSLESGTVPTPWKHAYVSPVFKKGDKANPKNYRPISLTSVVCKSMEHIIVSQITKHLQEHNILSDSQFGFESQHSCESQLFVTLHDITEAVDNKLQVDTAILDFSKAFDKVAHSRLLY